MTSRLAALLFLIALPSLRAHEASREMAEAATNFLAALPPEQKTLASFEFNSPERVDWHFIPRPRKGLSIKAMTQEQRLLAHALLATGLSHRGYAKAVSIMSLEGVLAEMEKGKVGGAARDPELYFVSIFGKPGTEPWGWRVEGHHLALNFTAAGHVAPSVTPAFFGTNPGEIREGPRAGTRILAEEEDLARAIVKGLTEEQRKIAIILPEAPKDVFNDPKRVDPTKPEGISAGKLHPDLQPLMVKLVKAYLFRHRPDVAAAEFAKIENAGWELVFFTWAGGLEKGQPHYYRVQNTSFVLEYDNTQNDANHVHSLWRDFGHDFGRDTLGQHVKEAHSKQAERAGN